MSDLISIIMPCHNGEKYLKESIVSVLQQTYNNWELLIINDNSSDSSEKIIKEFQTKDNRIHCLVNDNPVGMPSAPRNVGIENAKGRFIAFLDCDDKWLPTKLEKQITAYDENTAVVFSYYRKMDENGVESNSVIASPDIVNYKKLLNGNCIGNLTGMYDTSKVGKIFQKNIHHEDYLMWLEILRKGFIAKNTKTVEAVYREQKKSTSGNKLKAFTWTWNIYKKELNLPVFTSLFHFCIYAIKAVSKFIK